ncbi:MAG: hypothetical protein CMH63_03095 [Nanoarchaeota archaeon]|jgi:hypothetical protein|nr:hypothetical protein [Nanoarchaeota archaeon]|tara:strand:+ start:848 stop:1135 length:288 start_codon:yes stop_codon:yes gene_type:complete
MAKRMRFLRSKYLGFGKSSERKIKGWEQEIQFLKSQIKQASDENKSLRSDSSKTPLSGNQGVRQALVKNSELIVKNEAAIKSLQAKIAKEKAKIK